MARLLTTEITPEIGLVIKTIKEDDSFDALTLAIDDDVTDMRYVDNKEIKVVSGRLAKINYTSYGPSKKIAGIGSLKSSFASNVIATDIILDNSTEKHSDLITVPLREVIENAGVENVKRMKYFLTYGFKIKTSLTDGSENEFTVNEGDMLLDVKCLGKNGVETFSGKVGCIGYDADLEPTVVYFNVNGKLKAVDAIALISVGGDVPITEDTTSINDAISAATDGIVNLDSGNFEGAVNVSGDITIMGNQFGIPATNFKSRPKETAANETVISGKIVVAADSNVVLDGVTFAGDTLIEGTSGELTLRNCRLLDLNLPASGNLYPIKTNKGTEALKLNITNCFFGDNLGDGTGTGKVYNMMELNSTLADGSTISNNYFSNDCQTHNTVNVYEVEENATITISNNVWEKSANGIRIGTKGEPKATFMIENNTYLSTDEYTDWAGLLIIQPYGKSTTNMALLTIIINNTKHSDTYQLWYKYAGSADMQFTDYNVPTVIVDGEIELQPLVE